MTPILIQIDANGERCGECEFVVLEQSGIEFGWFTVPLVEDEHGTLRCPACLEAERRAKGD